jgi:hypothetical protein
MRALLVGLVVMMSASAASGQSIPFGTERASFGSAAGTDAPRLKAVRAPLAPIKVKVRSALDMAVTGDRIYRSTAYEDEIVVLDHEGTLLQRLDVVTPVGLLVLNGDLYVASRASNAILRFDLGGGQPSLVGTYPTAPTTHPEFLAYSGGRIWYSANCDYYDTDFGSMQPNGADATAFVPASVADGCPQVWGGGFAGDALIVGFDQSYDASVDPPVLRSQGAWHGGAWGFSADGTHTLVGASNGDVQEFALDELSTPTMTWSARASRAIAVSPAGDGSFAAAGRLNAPAASLEVFQGAGAEAFASYRFNAHPNFGEGPEIDRRMVAYSPDGGRLFVLASYGEERTPSRLHIIDPALAGTDLAITSRIPRKTTAGSSFTILGTSSGIQPGERVDVYLRDASDRTFRIATATVSDDGAIRASVKPMSSGFLFLGYRGNANAAPSESPQERLSVAARLTGKMVGGYRTIGSYRYFRTSQDVVYVVRTKPNLAGERLTVKLEFNRGSGWRSGGSARVRVRDDGLVAIGWRSGALPTYRYRLEARSEGSSDLREGSTGWTYFAVTT